MKIYLENETETLAFSKILAQCCQLNNHGITIYLEGDLGAGKTTLARGFIQHFGFEKVKSPTYSLVESYQNEWVDIHHFDCYRLSDPSELDYIGIRDYEKAGNMQLIEWAELAQGIIRPADITLKLSGAADKRELNISAHSTVGLQLTTCIK